MADIAADPELAETGTERLRPVNGIRIWYATFGRGKPVLLQHGGLANSNYWGNQVPALAKGYRVVVMDSRGHRRGVALLGGPAMMDAVLRRADYVVIAMPVTPESKGAIGRRELALMKPTAFLVNVARAEIVDEVSLFNALAERAIAGAALDVWYRYRSDGRLTLRAARPFHELPNVLMTPDVSGWTEGMLDARARLIAENIRCVGQGKPLLNLVR